MKKSFFSLSKTGIIYVFTSVFLVALSFYVYTQIKRLVDSSDLVNHTNQVMLSLEKINLAITDAETDQRGFILTSDSLLLEKRDAAFNRLNEVLNLIDSLTKDDPEHRKNFEKLQAALNEKLVSLKKVMKDYTPVPMGAEFKADIVEGVHKMDTVREQIYKMSLTEKTLLKQRSQKYSRLAFITPLFIIVLFLGALLILFVSYFRINKLLHQSQYLQENLEVSNKQLEKQNEVLEERNSFVETLINASIDLIIVIDKDLKFISANKKAEERFSLYYPHNITGKKLTEVIPNVPTADIEFALKGQALAVSKVKSVVSEKYYEINYIPLNKKNEVYAVMVISHDITERIQSEEEIRRLNQTFEYAEQVGMFGSYRYNFNTQEIEYSDNLYRLLGCEPQEFPASAENFMKFTHPDDVQYVLDATTEAFQHRHVSRWEYRMIRKDSQTIYVRGAGKILTDDTGVQWMIGTVQDITEEKQNLMNRIKASDELKQSEERYHRMVEEVQDYAIILLSKDGIVENWNKGAEKIKGYKAEEITGKNFSVFYTPEDRRNHLPEKLLTQATQTGKAIDENWRVRKDGSKFWGSIVITALYSNEKNILGFVKVTRDLSGKKIAEEEIKAKAEQLELKNRELEKMNTELQSFAYVSSHDLQEPLRKIQTFALRIIENDYTHLSEKGKDYFKRMQNAASRMQTLIEDLLAYSRTSTEERKFENTDLNKIVEEIKEEMKEELQQKHATIEAGEMCDATIIPFQFRQLMQNLIGNSLKFSNPQYSPQIRIKSEIAKGTALSNDKLIPEISYCHITISDNGIGFDQQYGEKIFEVFQRLHGRTEYTGTGIGLAIVKKIVENHNGFITASGEINKGATFDIYIPQPGEPIN